MKTAAVWLCAVLFFAGAAGAQQDENFTASTDWLRGLAESGNMEGRLLLFDQAMQGSSEAQYAVALLYRAGAAIPQDMDAARHWYRTAAAQEHRAALESLRLLASEGDGGAFHALGILSRDGLGVPRDAEAARQAFHWAGEAGHILGMFAEADMLAAGEGGAADEKGAAARYRQIVAAARAELHDLPAKTAGGDARAEAQYWIGRLYLAGGGGLRRSAVDAVAWFTDAANSGVNGAQYELALSYLRGRGVALDSGRARTWLKRAARQGMVAAQRELERLEAEQ